MDEVSYYDSQVMYQKRVGEVEKERLKLEREMFAMMNSDKKLQNLRAAKLRSYWQQICEREKAARDRNEELLRDFEQLEIKLASMESHTKRIKNMKMDYDEKVKGMYVKWHKDVAVARAKRQLQERNVTKQSVTSPKGNHDSTDHAPISQQIGQNKDPTRTSPQHILSDSGKSTSSKVFPNSTVPPANEPLLVQAPPPEFADRNSVKSKESTKSSPTSPQRAVTLIPTAAAQGNGNASVDFSISSEDSFVSTELNKSKLSSLDKGQNPEVIPKVIAATAHRRQSSEDSPERDNNTSPAHHKPPPKEIVIPGVSQEAPESKLSSDSFISEMSSQSDSALPDTTNRAATSSNPPLTDQAAYQAMLKQYSTGHAISEESDEDEFEELFSGDGTPRSTDKQKSQTAPSGDSSPKRSEPLQIPTEFSTRSSTLPRENVASHRTHKVDWETDSDEERVDGYLSNTGGSSKWDQQLRQYDDEDDDDFFN